jgi:hypothetical protein
MGASVAVVCTNKLEGIPKSGCCKTLQAVALVGAHQLHDCLAICISSWLTANVSLINENPLLDYSSSLRTLKQQYLKFFPNVVTKGLRKKISGCVHPLITAAPAEILKFALSLWQQPMDLWMALMRKMGREYAQLGFSKDDIGEIFDVLLNSILSCIGESFTLETELAWSYMLKFVLTYITLEKTRFLDDSALPSFTTDTEPYVNGAHLKLTTTNSFTSDGDSSDS